MKRTWLVMLACGLAAGGLAMLDANGRLAGAPALGVEQASTGTLEAAPAETATQTPAPASPIDSGDTAWVLTSSALVLLMTAPGLALFYGGLVRSKNVLGTLMQSFFALAVISLQWVLWGYSLAFSPGNAFIGSFDWVALRGVGLDPYPDYAATIPHQAFMVFQAMFAVITPALIAGAFAERMKFSAFVLFIVLWATFVYDPLAHMVWGLGGFLRSMGALDFAGGTVVHISSGVSALAAALVIGRRQGYRRDPMPPHNLPLTVLGAGLLWFGWFGFNAGSALGAGALATNAFVTTHVATATATLVWVLLEWVNRGKPTVLGAASGAVAGLVAITPACGFVTVTGALAVGALAGGVCQLAVMAKNGLGYDDSLDAFGIHGIGGTWGALATGLFATVAINSAGADGLLYGNAALLWAQVKAVAVSWVYAFAVTFLILKVLDKLVGLRVAPEQEQEGLDLTQHSERAYVL
jgi:Amt family ammonium transporter